MSDFCGYIKNMLYPVLGPIYKIFKTAKIKKTANKLQNHYEKVIENIKESGRKKIRFAALVHDLGKGVTPKEMYPHHYGHDKNGVPEVSKFANRLKMPNDWASCGKTAAKEHMKGGIFYKMTPSKQVDFIERVYKTKLGLKGLEIVVEADRNCRGNEPDNVQFARIGRKVNE